MRAVSGPPLGRWAFGPFVLDAAAYRLTRDGVDVAVSPRHIELLAVLATRPAALVTKEELIATGWPDVAVSDNSLTQVISDLRQALADSASQPAYIQTVARRGYRFIAPVEPVAPDGTPTRGAERPRRARETSSLEAARAFNEGRWRLEALDAELVPEAIQQFEHAIALDATYAAAHLGLANALFWAFEASRDLMPPATAALTRAVDAARRAVALEPDLGEAHATLSYVLVGAGLADEARAAALRAVTLEPGYWGHHFRLGHASWGGARLTAHARTLELYPDFAFAHFQMAMVFVARGDLPAADSALRQGLIVHERHRGKPERFPAQGLHWLLGLVLAARGDVPGALVALEAETSPVGGRLYAREFAVGACYGIGALRVATGDIAGAATAIDRALTMNPSHARALAARSVLPLTAGEATAARDAFEQALAALARAGRHADGVLARAAGHALRGETDAACRSLGELVDRAPAGPAGWNIAVEPAFAPLRSLPAFDRILSRVAERAR
jgi:DNA-binding winged helix-turn-helix (wHTH) protein